MYVPEKPRPIDFGAGGDDSDEAAATATRALMAVDSLPRHHLLLDPTTAPQQKKRAETWGQDETRVLIGLRREVDSVFNTSKSNKHLWEQISSKMREKGFDRSPTMCTDKWRNLMKEYKKHTGGGGGGGQSLSPKMTCYRELQDLLRERNNKSHSPSPPAAAATNIAAANAASKLDLFVHFSENGLGDGIPFGSGEDASGPTINIERNLDHDDDPLALATADAVAASGLPPWNWRENPGDGGERNNEYGGRVITVKWGVHVRKIGIDGSREAIKEAIKSTFRLRTNRAFWLEDEFNVTRSFDRSMPLGEYTLHVDEGISIKLCHYDESDPMVVRTVDKTLYTEDHFRDFLNCNGYTGLRELNGYKTFDNLSDIRAGSMYQGVIRR